jgi:hypothetical protein
MSIFMDFNEYNRQLLGSMEIYGTMFYGASGNEYGMRLAYSHSLAKRFVDRDTTDML